MAKAYSGKDGTIEGVGGLIVKWKATISAYKKEFGYAGSGGWQAVVFGIKKVEGTIDAKIEGGVLPTVGGDFVELSLDSGGGIVLSGLAAIDSVDVEVNFENGEPVSGTYKFSSNGEWTGAGGEAEGSTSGAGGSPA